MEEALTHAFATEGVELVRAHEVDDTAGHGFIDSQRRGIEVFDAIPRNAAVVVAEAVWQYSHHVLAGLRRHRGPILTVANWSGTWPGLVGLLNLNGSLTKARVPYATLWSEDFQDDTFMRGLRQWFAEGRIDHDAQHVRSLDAVPLGERARSVGNEIANGLRERVAIIGVFDEGCMGMYNAIIDDELLNPLGIYKERLSQSALYARMRTVDDREADAALTWLDERGMRFEYGEDPAVDLTRAQVLEQLKMYIAAVRMAAEFGCDAIGIQYQQGLKDLTPASDLVEGLLNASERPPVMSPSGGPPLYEGRPLPHFNEVDEGAAVDALIANRVWTHLGHDPATTLHDLRWGEPLDIDGRETFVWTLEISGAVPASHLEGGYAGATGYRQPAMYFPRGGSTLSGVCRPGDLVWSRTFIAEGVLSVDIGRASAITLPESETARRRALTTPEWPILHAVLHGVSRDQMMARHKANHIQVTYAPSPDAADDALACMAATFDALGVRVNLCGDVRLA